MRRSFSLNSVFSTLYPNLLYTLLNLFLFELYSNLIYSGKKLEDGKGIGGTGRLMLQGIDAIQNFYGHVIRKNKGNTDAMARGTRAILKHYSAGSEEDCHEDCPEGLGVAINVILLPWSTLTSQLKIHFLL